MAEFDEFNKHEETLSKKGKAIAQQILKEQMEQAKKRDTQREEPIQNKEQMQDMERSTSPPHVSPSQYLTTPHNLPTTSPVRTEMQEQQGSEQMQQNRHNQKIRNNKEQRKIHKQNLP